MENKRAHFVHSISPKGNRAAMEMSVGTIVTIVLLMTVLILGLVLVRNIFSVGNKAIDGTGIAVQNEINKLFTEDDSRKVVLVPEAKIISIKKGNKDYLGFAVGVRNVETEGGVFKYTVEVSDPDIRNKCGINAGEAEGWIAAGASGDFELDAGDSNVDNPIWVRFLVPEDAPPCLVRYAVNVKKEGQSYGGTQFMDVKIEPR